MISQKFIHQMWDCCPTVCRTKGVHPSARLRQPGGIVLVILLVWLGSAAGVPTSEGGGGISGWVASLVPPDGDWPHDFTAIRSALSAFDEDEPAIEADVVSRV